jgi:predicted metalloprotease
MPGMGGIRIGGGGGRMAAGGGGIGIVIIVLLFIVLGGNPQQLLQNMPQGGPGGPGAIPTSPMGSPGGTAAESASEADLRDFVTRVLGDTEDVWNEQFRSIGAEYREPALVLFREEVRSGCGVASAASGPFYCPADEKIYIDLSFYEELSQKFGAPGDFAQAYVIAHEVGHHVQKLLGTMDEVHSARERMSESEYNDLSVRLELQADYYAGVWAHHAQAARQVLEAGDIEEGLRAASSIGDDRIQLRSRGYVTPESFTHGTSEQRVRWFKKGLESGDLRAGNTFDVPKP